MYICVYIYIYIYRVCLVPRRVGWRPRGPRGETAGAAAAGAMALKYIYPFKPERGALVALCARRFALVAHCARRTLRSSHCAIAACRRWGPLPGQSAGHLRRQLLESQQGSEWLPHLSFVATFVLRGSSSWLCCHICRSFVATFVVRAFALPHLFLRGASSCRPSASRACHICRSYPAPLHAAYTPSHGGHVAPRQRRLARRGSDDVLVFMMRLCS